MKKTARLAAMILLAVALIYPAARAAAIDAGLIGTWAWEETYLGEESGEERGHSLTLTFAADGTIKLEPFYYDHGADTAYGIYETDGGLLRVTITKVVPFFEGEDSVYFEEGEQLKTRYVLRGDAFEAEIFGETRTFARVK
jgi:hypothetical protein